MPIHDWTRVTARIFHDFHSSWIIEIKRALKQGQPDRLGSLCAKSGACPAGRNPLEDTYRSAWESVPAVWQEALSGAKLPGNGRGKSRRTCG
jgi:hypothetical protein